MVSGNRSTIPGCLPETFNLYDSARVLDDAYDFMDACILASVGQGSIPVSHPAEVFDSAVGQLGNLAVAKLEGYSNADFALRLEVPQTTPSRCLHLDRVKISKNWLFP